MLEAWNYENDFRVRALNRKDAVTEVNESTMRLFLDLGELGSGWVRFTYDVCETCNGKGSHVDPSIDSMGLTREDFDADPEFERMYFKGRYNVACYECGGRRVTPVLAPSGPEEKALVEKYKEWMKDEAEYEAMCRAERMMGA